MDFTDSWRRRFSNCEPIAHRLRDAFPDRWVRFHSLPGSKRYPEDGGEYAVVLHRHNRILGDLAFPGQSVAPLSTGYSCSPESVRLQNDLQRLDPGASPWRTVPMRDPGEEATDPNFWHIFASVWGWRVGLFDPIIRLVADDALANVMIVDRDCRWLLHPYDAGMDVDSGVVNRP